MRFHIRWPNGANEVCYSPSLIIKEHVAVGQTYPLHDFLTRIRTALMIASDRVREKYGFPCSRALGQLARIETTAGRFDVNGDVTIIAFEE